MARWLSHAAVYHWQELQQIDFCHNKHMFVTTKVCLLQKASFMTKVCLSRQKKIVTINMCLSQNLCCNKHTFVMTKDRFCRDKHVFCNKSKLVATKIVRQRLL